MGSRTTPSLLLHEFDAKFYFCVIFNSDAWVWCLKMKATHLKVLAGLLRDSRASDRTLAQKIGVSQPTITRTRGKLKEEGYTREYSMIPDFHKLGFQFMALTLIKFNNLASKEETFKLRKFADDVVENAPFAVLMSYEGAGLGHDVIFVTLHENYKSYAEFLRSARDNEYRIDSFKIDLASGSHYLPLTFSRLADYVLRPKK